MTLPEFIRERVTWRDRFVCLVLGHRPYGRSPHEPWSPTDEAEDRRALEQPAFCGRCGLEGIKRCGCGCSD